MAEWYDINGNADGNANEDNIYQCDCGCKLQFRKFAPGLDIYVGQDRIITQLPMLKYTWSDYLQLDVFNTWMELKEYITVNCNNALNYIELEEVDAPWIHLYNKYIAREVDFPLNARLSYECNF